mmetsp:Transcript_9879/g.21933  ORF Transcript_9879/g.21933 Transcript_9879/m.21933 type:complete len:236 (-) Transcript_9879:650-1357(-)
MWQLRARCHLYRQQNPILLCHPDATALLSPSSLHQRQSRQEKFASQHRVSKICDFARCVTPLPHTVLRPIPWGCCTSPHTLAKSVLTLSRPGRWLQALLVMPHLQGLELHLRCRIQPVPRLSAKRLCLRKHVLHRQAPSALLHTKQPNEATGLGHMVASHHANMAAVLRSVPGRVPKQCLLRRSSPHERTVRHDEPKDHQFLVRLPRRSTAKLVRTGQTRRQLARMVECASGRSP